MVSITASPDCLLSQNIRQKLKTNWTQLETNKFCINSA